MGLNPTESSREIDPVAVWESNPVAVSKARYLQWIAGDHLEREVDLWIRVAKSCNHLRKVENAGSERNF